MIKFWNHFDLKTFKSCSQLFEKVNPGIFSYYLFTLYFKCYFYLDVLSIRKQFDLFKTNIPSVFEVTVYSACQLKQVFSLMWHL